MSTSTPPDDPREQVSSHSRVLTMHEMPSSNSMATTGKGEHSKSERIDTPTLVVDSKVAKVDLAVDSEHEEDSEVATEQEVEDLVEEVALAGGEVMAEGSEVVVGSKVVLEEDLVVNKVAGTGVPLKKPPLPILSPTLPQVVVNAAKSSLCEM